MLRLLKTGTTNPVLRFILCIGVAALLLAGCETTRIQKTEVVAGIVIDSGNQKPVAGAKVMFLDRRNTVTTTNENGKFICGPGYMQVPMELGFPLTFGPETRIKISAPGYVTKVVQAYPRVEWTQKNQMKRSKVLMVRLDRIA